MKKRLIISLFLTGALFSCSGKEHPGKSKASPRHTIQVQINKNVELLGFVYFLGYQGNYLEKHDEFLKGRPIKKRDWYAYGYHLYQQYKVFTKSKNLAIAINFMENIWLDKLVSLLIRLDDFPNAKLTDEIPEEFYIYFSPVKNPAEARKNANRFILALNQLHQEVNFPNYLRQNEKKYAHAVQQVKERLPEGNFIPAMENFYRGAFSSYTLIPSLTIPTGMAFGQSYSLKDKTNICNVFGPFGLQHFKEEEHLDMGFGNEQHLREISTHEFGHSFVNPAVDKLPQELIADTEALFIPVKNAMAAQGYVRWKACLYEHFVRAGEILIAEKLENSAAAERLKVDYIENRKFVYLPVILEELRLYDKSFATTYPEAVKKVLERMKVMANKK